ncbi:MAG: rhomboid family intramembrane serine protease [Bacteroidales bacterium]|nr:rhomboid family intramembrane serine protease [Bacteroidales bacterium]
MMYKQKRISVMSRFRSLSMPLMLVIINVVVLLGVTLCAFISRIGGGSLNLATLLLDMPGGLKAVMKPWTVITYMFTQTDVMHCLFNMLWLYWFGVLWERFSSGRHLLQLYFLSGLGGAIAFFLMSITNGGSGMYLEGASAAVMGIVAATAIMIPNVKLNLFLFGAVKLKWIAIISIVFFALGASGHTATAHWAHLGGAVAGAAYAMWLKYIHLKPRITHKVPSNSARAREELDELLDKVRVSGYGSLTANERRRLFELSHRV